VPSFSTDIERRAMIASCQMAGLNCLKVMNDTTAGINTVSDIIPEPFEIVVVR